MSIIVWDGDRIVADRQGCSDGLRITRPKLYKINDYAVGFVGVGETGELLLQWFRQGADAERWPSSIANNEWDGTIMIIAGSDGVRYYCQYPVAEEVYDKFRAWGCGRDFAVGALAMGADAVKAAAVTCEFDIHCGNGIDVIECATLAKLPEVG